MKRRLLLGSILWTVLITALHLAVNIGFGAFGQELRVFVGMERPGLRVGFLPVT